MNAHRFAQKAYGELKATLTDSGLIRPGVFLTVNVADYASQSDLDFFKSDWALETYQDALAKFEKLNASEPWTVNAIVMSRRGYDDFTAINFLSPSDYILEVLGIHGANAVSCGGRLPLVLISQPIPLRSVATQPFATVAD